MSYVRYILLVITLTGCVNVRNNPAPSSQSIPPNFEPTGETAACGSCGERALELCQHSGGPASYPKWFGFNGSGTCMAVCSSGGPIQDISNISGTPQKACGYHVNTVIKFNNREVCPHGTPERGDRDFWGHGPHISGHVIATPDSSGSFVIGKITATWAETASDYSTITLPLTTVGKSDTLTMSPPFRAQATRVTSVTPARSSAINIVMSSRQQEIISPALGDPLVEQLTIVGDTQGADISDDANCNDDARVHSITFKPVRVTIGPRP